MIKLRHIAAIAFLRYKKKVLLAFSGAIFLLIGMAAFACQDSPYVHGERAYKTNCANCHMEGGQGLGALIPPLAGADYLSKNREILPCIVQNGLTDTITVNGTVYAEKMVGHPKLSDIQITNILNYINTSWGNTVPVFTLEEVRNTLKMCSNQ
jgi:mono/diheme cytochrome c family protein